MPDFAVRTAFTAVDKISPAFRNMESSASSFQKTASRAFRAIGTLVSGYLINSFIEAAASAERMNVAFGSVFGGDAASQMGFVRDEAKRLGLDLQASADAYKSISAAAKGSAISNAMVKEVFIGVSEGAAALQLSSEQTSGALTALSQMISKGKVQAEELRGQLGERIPGAFQIAARAMNMTTSELDKFMSDGKLTAELFIPRFAAQMRKEFGPAAMDAANSFSAARNRFNNAVFDFEVGVGSVLLPALSDLMLAFMPVIDVMGQFFRENQEGISEIVKLVPWLVGGFIAWKIAIFGVVAAQTAMNLAEWISYLWEMRDVIAGAVARTWLWTAAQWALNAAMDANIIGLIILGITALIAAGVLLYKNWEPIKEFFSGLWDGIVSGFNAAIDWIIQKFTAVVDWVANKWEPISEFFSGLWSGIVEGFNAAIDWIIQKFTAVVDWVANKWGKVKSFFGSAGDSAAQAIAVYKNWEPISEFFSGLWDGIVDGFNAAIDWIIQKFTAVVDWVANKWGKVKGFFGFANDAGKNAPNSGVIKSPNESGANLRAGNTNVNIYSNGTEAKAEVTPRRGATVNMNRLGYQQ